MAINRRLLNALLTRDIRTTEFLAMSQQLDGIKPGPERALMQEKIAEEIEKQYPLRKKLKT